MKRAILIGLLSAMLAGAGELAIRAERRGHVLVLSGVYLNGVGPLRMMVDTGAASCSVRPRIGRLLGLRPTYAVEMETATGVQVVPAAELEEVRIGSAVDHQVEVLLSEGAWNGVDGVLGQSWLSRHDYLVDYRSRSVVLDGLPPQKGVRLPLQTSEGRPAFVAEVNGKPQELVIDSGASALVLFGAAARVRNAVLQTNNGMAEAGMVTARLNLGGLRRQMDAVYLESALRPGLLPAAYFRAVFVSNRERLVVLIP